MGSKQFLKQRKGVKKPREKNTVTDADKIEVLKMFHHLKMKQRDIAIHFNVSPSMISRILSKAEKNHAGQNILAYDPSEVLTRTSLSPFERAKKISEDALQNCELVMSMVRYELELTHKAMLEGKEFARDGISIEKMTKFLQVAAPYVLDRKDGKTVKPEDATPAGKMHKLMGDRTKTA